MVTLSNVIGRSRTDTRIGTKQRKASEAKQRSAVTAERCSVTGWGQGRGRGEWRGSSGMDQRTRASEKQRVLQETPSHRFPLLRTARSPIKAPREGETAAATAELALNQRASTPSSHGAWKLITEIRQHTPKYFFFLI